MSIVNTQVTEQWNPVRQRIMPNHKWIKKISLTTVNFFFGGGIIINFLKYSLATKNCSQKVFKRKGGTWISFLLHTKPAGISLIWKCLITVFFLFFFFFFYIIITSIHRKTYFVIFMFEFTARVSKVCPFNINSTASHSFTIVQQ